MEKCVYTLTASTTTFSNILVLFLRIGSIHSIMNSSTCCGDLPMNKEGSTKESNLSWTAENKESAAIRSSKSLWAPSSLTLLPFKNIYN